MFEHRTEPLLSKQLFRQRLRSHVVIGTEILSGSLLMGTMGFHWLAGQEWIDALLNSSMLLGGMGPVGDIQGVWGKLFATFFSLFAGIVFLAVVAILFAPVFHRFLHKFHLEEHRKNKE